MNRYTIKHVAPFNFNDSMVDMILRTILQFCVLMMIPALALSQSLSLSATPETSGNSLSEFPLKGGKNVELKSGQARFLSAGSKEESFSAVGFSDDRSVVALVSETKGKAQVRLFTPGGDTLSHYSSVTLRSNDPSLAIFPSETGHALLRDNIMNFTFHNGIGIVGGNLSTGSGSKQGETVTEVAASPDHGTVIFYTPKIKRGSTLGSKADLLLADRTLCRIFQDDSRYIKTLQLSRNGNIAAVVTSAEGADDKVSIIDKYGNEINTLTSGEELAGARLSAGGTYLTLYSASRVRVYNVLNGERLGSTSLTEPVYLADYFPDDEMLLILSGDFTSASGVLNNIEMKAVDLGRRDIVSKSFSGALRFHPSFTPAFNRTAANKYRLSGANKDINIAVAF